MRKGVNFALHSVVAFSAQYDQDGGRWGLHRRYLDGNCYIPDLEPTKQELFSLKWNYDPFHPFDLQISVSKRLEKNASRRILIPRSGRVGRAI